MTITFDHPIFNAMLDAFDAHARANDNFDETESLRDMILTDPAPYTTTFRANSLDDCAILRLDLDDELETMTLIAFYQRDTLTLRDLIFDTDCTAAMINL